MPLPARCCLAAAALLVSAAALCAQLPSPNTRLTAQEVPTSPQEPQTGSLRGEVTDADGAVVQGARITLVTASANSNTLTDRDGHFFFHDLQPGPYSLSVTLAGFNPAVETGNLQPGQTMELPDISLSLATVDITVSAITPEQAALQQLHTEEQQRLVGVLPNFFVSYSWTAPPLTTHQKFVLSLHNAIDPGNAALSATTAGVQQADNAFPGYHQGAAGYGKRFGADYANLWAGTFMGGAILPTLFHQDPRYFYKGTGTIRSRFFYSISRAVICRGDNGHWQPNFSGVLGDLSAGAISNIYYAPSDRQGARLTLENGFLGVAGDAMNGFVQEFVLSHFTTRGKKPKKP